MLVPTYIVILKCNFLNYTYNVHIICRYDVPSYAYREITIVNE